jgi:hypothetical protein
MDTDPYSDLFEMSHNEALSDPVELILFSVSFYRLVIFSEKKLLEIAKCPKSE